MGEVLGAVLAVVLPLVIGLLAGNQGWKRRFNYLEKSVAIRDSMDSEKDASAIAAMDKLITDQARVLRDQVPLRRDPAWLLVGLPPALGGSALLIYGWAALDVGITWTGGILYLLGMSILAWWLVRQLHPPAK